jgi:16S rRNA (guanine1207-N2)-methyltransferase
MTDKTSGEQYFTTNPNADHHFQQFDFELLDHQLHFTTDSGVFPNLPLILGLVQC